VILLFALIPVAGGVIKGVGRLALRVTGDIAKDSKLLVEVIEFLNRVGHGNAQKWLKALDVMKYQAELLSKFKNFCATVNTAIRESLNARVGKILPEVWRTGLEKVGAGIDALKDLADRMIPQALKELDAKLKVLQQMVYRGELHEIATGGAPKIEREAEAYLEERKLAREIRHGKFPSAECFADGSTIEARVRARYEPKIKQGWPDILQRKGKATAFGDETVFTQVASFHGEVRALEAHEIEGKTLYRVFGKPSKLAPAEPGTFAGGRRPAFWGFGAPPKSAEEWRMKSAVLDEWNGNGFIAVVHVPAGFSERVPGAKAWAGQIAEQWGDKVPQYLEGGAEQLIVDLGTLADDINKIGEDVKASGQAAVHILEGNVRVEFYPTHWTNIEEVYGYSDAAAHAQGTAQTRKLASDEIHSKMTPPPNTTNKSGAAATSARAGNATEDQPH
jgi:hypothetical protein